jgi:hypothetical protein
VRPDLRVFQSGSKGGIPVSEVVGPDPRVDEQRAFRGIRRRGTLKS